MAAKKRPSVAVLDECWQQRGGPATVRKGKTNKQQFSRKKNIKIIGREKRRGIGGNCAAKGRCGRGKVAGNWRPLLIITNTDCRAERAGPASIQNGFQLLIIA
jgi:hypothetical protein